MWDSAWAWSLAFWRRCSSGTAGRPSWRCWRSTASARCWRHMGWCRGWGGVEWARLRWGWCSRRWRSASCSGSRACCWRCPPRRRCSWACGICAAHTSIRRCTAGRNSVEQLTFELAPIEPPSFANFLAGPNVEAVTALRQLAQGDVRETGILVWGAPGSGRTPLLHAVVAAAHTWPSATYYPGPASAPAEPPVAGALVAIDDVEDAAPEAQG